ncbi:MAG: carboxylesterase family protein [Labilithrix sp.]|nr:carboxylesterase family protein [Labilithrix sp.]
MRPLGLLFLGFLGAWIGCSGAGPDLVAPSEPAPARPRDPNVVTTAEGDVRGSVDGETRVFKAIPFAAPPVGELRWRPPAPVTPWQGVRDGGSFSSACTQLDPRGVRTIGSEDCLYLNVWAPRAATSEPLPVLFWMHGGDNVIGSATEPSYDARQLAEGARAVVITINYRLGAFGFLAHPAFARENEHGSTGNYAVLDAIAALQWVQRNVAAFGGDPARVLVFGQSAGASNTCALVGSPLAKGLFSRAMMLSLACHILAPGVVASTNASVERHLGCEGAADVAACLRSQSARDVARLPGASLVASEVPADYYETIDGWVLPDHPETTMSRGKHNEVPMILGTTRDEYQSVIDLMLAKPVETEAELREIVTRWFGARAANALLPLYPFASYASGRDALVAIVSDHAMHCPTRRAARAAVRGQRAPVFRYLFSQVPTAGAGAAYGAAHGLDVDYVFRTFRSVTPTPEDLAFAEALVATIGRFAATGDPGDARWPRYDLATDPYVVLRSSPEIAHGLRAKACDLWDEIAPDS